MQKQRSISNRWHRNSIYVQYPSIKAERLLAANNSSLILNKRPLIALITAFYCYDDFMRILVLVLELLAVCFKLGRGAIYEVLRLNLHHRGLLN